MDADGRLPGVSLRLEGSTVLAGPLALYLDEGFGWLVHSGEGRLLGYGLEYPRAFRDTQLQRV